MRAVSLFSGAGGLDLGLERAGIEHIAICEIDPTARSVLAHRFPDVPTHDDVTTFKTERLDGTIDLVHGGSPCQDLSVAGRRAGLDGSRSGLFWHQCRVADQVAARWVLWENVLGALSSNGGADLAAVLWGLTGALPDMPDDGRWRSCGVVVGPKRTAVWRVLDARWFGVAQRRRRVFVVAGPGDRRVAEVLLEPESCPRGDRPGDQEGPVVAALTRNGVGGGGGPDDNAAQAGHLIPALTTRCGNTQDDQQVGQSIPFVKTVRSGARDTDGNLPAERWEHNELAPTLNAMDNGGETRATVLAFHLTQDPIVGEDFTPALSIGSPGGAAMLGVASEASVRRLTPRECERLMGWPDDWTRWRADGTEVADSHRYRMCGNGVVAPVAEWIGRRLMEVAA